MLLSRRQTPNQPARKRLSQRSFLRWQSLRHAAMLGTVASALVACSPTRVLTAISPASDIQIVTDVAYGQLPRQRLDIYRPNRPVGVSSPVVVFVYGGSWESGSKDGYGFVGKSLAQAGYTTVVIDYRLAPAHRYPTFVQDTADAIAWTYRHIGQYGGQAEQMFVMGHSAGAFNAIAAVNDARFWHSTGVPDQAVLGVVGLAGPYAYDFRDYPSKRAFPVGGDPELIMPDRHPRPNAPAHYLLTAERDQVVFDFNTERMQHALQSVGVPVQVGQVSNVGHARMIVAMATPMQFLGQTRQMVLDYMAQRLADQATRPQPSP
ncbi:MAG: alpha/beta hydrolase [Pseudomonadota bacterium]|nr:alpha/beta hydrolase [Pseudomonadota bacterium]